MNLDENDQIITFCGPLGVFVSITHACKKTKGKLDFLILSAKYFNPRKWASNGPRLLSAALASECDISPEDFAQSLSIGPGTDFNFISKEKDYF